jgi:membrane protease YdiL (CAAX protease family)
LPSGFWRGVVGAVIVLPLMFCAAIALEAIYKAFQYKHPSEHDLLRAMKESSRGTRATLIIGACVAAPIFEEYLFRGHIQTILVRLFSPRMPAVDQLPITFAAELPPSPMPAPNGPPRLEYASPAAPTRERSALMMWLAVIVTSMLFASVHTMWMAPLIFVLSLCLGYAYERTGNLWVPIVIHAIFNTVSTVEFLNLVQ